MGEQGKEKGLDDLLGYMSNEFSIEEKEIKQGSKFLIGTDKNSIREMKLFSRWYKGRISTMLRNYIVKTVYEQLLKDAIYKNPEAMKKIFNDPEQEKIYLDLLERPENLAGMIRKYEEEHKEDK